MALDIGRKLPTEPTAFIDEINIACTRPGMNDFRPARSCDVEAGKLPIKTIRLFWCEHRVTQFVSGGESFGS
jgi:hypothetical protein